MKASEFVFDYVDRLFYRYHQIILNCIGSYRNSSKWLENRKAIIKSKIMIICVLSMW